MRRGSHHHSSGITSEAYFWSLVAKNLNGDCWLWQGPIYKHYGKAHFEGKTWCAHRLAYQLLWGAIPGGKHLDHLCGDTLCVYPWHLEPVTPAENNRRKVLRRRPNKTRSAIPSPARLRQTSKELRRAAWYKQWLQSFRPQFTPGGS